MAKLTIDNLNLKNQKVLIRCDFNVPLDDNLNITDDRRIVASLPTIKKVLSEGGTAILCSHLGRPKGQIKEEMRLKPVAEKLQSILGVNVIMAKDCIGAEVLEQKRKNEAKNADKILKIEKRINLGLENRYLSKMHLFLKPDRCQFRPNTALPWQGYRRMISCCSTGV